MDLFILDLFIIALGFCRVKLQSPQPNQDPITVFIEIEEQNQTPRSGLVSSHMLNSSHGIYFIDTDDIQNDPEGEMEGSFGKLARRQGPAHYYLSQEIFQSRGVRLVKSLKRRKTEIIKITQLISQDRGHGERLLSLPDFQVRYFQVVDFARGRGG